MEYETTNISDLPTNPQTSINNLPVMNTNMPTNEILNSQTYNQVMNECMGEVNQHENSPSLKMPSQDIPINPVGITNDPSVRADYIPPKGKDTIGNVKKVRFGDPGMKIKSNIPSRKRSFMARMGGVLKKVRGQKTLSPAYWSLFAWRNKIR